MDGSRVRTIFGLGLLLLGICLLARTLTAALPPVPVASKAAVIAMPVPPAPPLPPVAPVLVEPEAAVIAMPVPPAPPAPPAPNLFTHFGMWLNPTAILLAVLLLLIWGRRRAALTAR